MFLAGAWYEESGELWWQGLGHLKTSEVGAVLESTVTRIDWVAEDMDDPVLIGLALTSHNADQATSAVFSSTRSAMAATSAVQSSRTGALRISSPNR